MYSATSCWDHRRGSIETGTLIKLGSIEAYVCAILEALLKNTSNCKVYKVRKTITNFWVLRHPTPVSDEAS